MPSITGWVKSTYQTKGLDPLGAQAPSIYIYSQLLPGITNVTDRARYYSFYPWMVWAYEQQPGEKTYDGLIEWVRRSDCLYTMTGIRHRYSSGDENHAIHEQGLIGSQTLHKIIANLGPNDSLQLSDYTSLEDGNQLRYFKTPLGGLKQYYLGTFDSLGLMTSKGKGVANTKELGIPLAQKMDSAVNRALFSETIHADSVTLDDLDALSSFCPCRIQSSTAEHAALLDLFFERGKEPSSAGLQRRQSLGLMLELVHSIAHMGHEAGYRFDQAAFRGCIYAGALSGDKAWDLPPNMATTRTQWKAYQAHELLSVAVQCIFRVALEALLEEQPHIASVEDFTQWFTHYSALTEAASDLGASNYRLALDNTRATLPAVANWLDDNHEMSLAARALSTLKSRTASEDLRVLLGV